MEGATGNIPLQPTTILLVALREVEVFEPVLVHAASLEEVVSIFRIAMGRIA